MKDLLMCVLNSYFLNCMFTSDYRMTAKLNEITNDKFSVNIENKSETSITFNMKHNENDSNVKLIFNMDKCNGLNAMKIVNISVA